MVDDDATHAAILADQEVQDERRLFEPSLWIQRRRKVAEQLRKYSPSSQGIQSVLDLGCGEGALLNFLVGERSVERLAGVDALESRLEYAAETLRPTEMDRLMLRDRPLRIDLCCGDLCEPAAVDARISQESWDALTCVEVVEHIEPELLDRFAKTLFSGFPRVGMIVLTTPNADYNIHFPSMQRHEGCDIGAKALPIRKFRDPDHKFEWSRSEFQAWCEAQADRYGWQAVEYFGVGVLKGLRYDAGVGFCTQGVVFKKTTEAPQERQARQAGEPCSVHWQRMHQITFPFFDASAVTDAEIWKQVSESLVFVVRRLIIEELEDAKRKETEEDMREMETLEESELSVRMGELWYVHEIRQLCGGEHSRLKNVLRLYCTGASSGIKYREQETAGLDDILLIYQTWMNAHGCSRVHIRSELDKHANQYSDCSDSDNDESSGRSKRRTRFDRW